MFREYCKKAAKSRAHGLFYAWFDEMSGTLRCSFYETDNIAELLFRCKIRGIDDSTRIAALALSSPYAAGIPSKELSTIDPFEGDAGERAFELIVLVRPTITIA